MSHGHIQPSVENDASYLRRTAPFSMVVTDARIAMLLKVFLSDL